LGLLDRRAKASPAHYQGPPSQIAIIDVETTGLDARVDRVIEVGIVITDQAGNVIDEWSSLVRPDEAEWSKKAQAVHLIDQQWLNAAPTFPELLPQIAHRLQGRIIAAHNAQFDLEFLQEEFKRAGYTDAHQGTWSWLCTLDLARAIDAPRRLDQACFHLGIRYEKHSALGDAHACGQLLWRFMSIIDPKTFIGAGVTQFGYLPELTLVQTVPRQFAAAATTARPVLEHLIASLPPHDGTTDRDPAASESYLVALEDALADGYLAAAEVASLSQLASTLRLSSEEVRDLHQELVMGLIERALDDRRITKDERAEVERAARWLNVDVSAWDTTVRAARARIKADIETFRAEVRGKIVAFSGAGIHKANIREALALKHGFGYSSRVTAETDVLVIGSGHTQNQQVEAARGNGVPIVVEASFWQRLGEV
jgi:DNA polymerase III subunit epsilon